MEISIIYETNYQLHLTDKLNPTNQEIVEEVFNIKKEPTFALYFSTQ